ncbi:MAG: hypothetical protein ABIX37_11515 [Gammaproteobacteria bacterium]
MESFLSGRLPIVIGASGAIGGALQRALERGFLDYRGNTGPW